MNGWESFFVAEAGASAALTGLIFVGVSINLTKILSIPRLPNRAFEALLLLLSVLVVSSLLLVPEQAATWVGTEVLAVGVIVWVTMIMLDRGIWRNTKAEYRASSIILIVMNQLATLSYIVAGVVILVNGFTGLYWLVPGVILCFIKALLDSWVLLVEINR